MQRRELWDAHARQAEGTRTEEDQDDYYTYTIISRQQCHRGGRRGLTAEREENKSFYNKRQHGVG